MILILKVIALTTAMILAMLLGLVGIVQLDISPNMTSFLVLSWIAIILYVPKYIFKEKDVDKK